MNKNIGSKRTLFALTSLWITLATSLHAQEALVAEPSDVPGVYSLSTELPSLDSSRLAQPELQLPTPKLAYPSIKSPLLAAGLSGIFPGLGHVYLGDMRTAGGFLGSTGLNIGIAALANGFIKPSVLEINFITLQATSFYGVYAAYRDARLYNKQWGYSYNMPTDSLLDLAAAPFRWSVLKKPEVWGGLWGSLAVATAVTYFVCFKESPSSAAATMDSPWFPLAALPVGIGEEAFFRGFLLPQFSEWTTPWGGIVLSSLVFGAMHLPNAMSLEPEIRSNYYTFSIPLITTLGAYYGWVTYKNCSLQESVALHTWYDFTLFALGAWASQAVVGGRANFSISFSF